MEQEKLQETAQKLKDKELLLRQTEQKLRQAEQKLHQSEQKLHQSEQKLNQTEQKLRQTEQKVQRTEEKLRKANQRINELDKLASFGGQYQDLGRFVKQLRQERGFSLGWCGKYALYLLAWVPAKYLIATGYLLKNGASAAVKRLIGKITKHG